MPKFYKKRYSSAARDRYSVEQTAFTLSTNTSGAAGQTVVPASTTQGMRKVKHLMVQVADHQPSTSGVALYWALVYVPQGTSALPLQVDSGTMYEPNQYVMGCGVFDFNGGPLRIHCPLSRNLNSGDSIALIVQASDATASQLYHCVVRYAVTLQ